MEYRAEDYQTKAIDYIVKHKKCMLCMEAGMGKLSIVLSAMYSLKYDYFEKKKIVILTSKAFAMLRWIPETKKWDHLSSLSYFCDFGEINPLKIPAYADVIFTSVDRIKQIVIQSEFKDVTLVIDQAYLLNDTEREHYITINEVVKGVDRLVFLCDWNVKSNLGDLWNIIYLIDSGKRLGANKAAYLDKYFYRSFSKKNGKKTVINFPKPSSWKKISAKIQDVCYAASRNQCVRPGIRVTHRYISIYGKEYSKYQIAKRIAEVSSIMSEKKEAKHFADMAYQYSDGVIMNSDGSVNVFHEEKLNELERIIASMPYTKILIVAPYEFESDVILAKIPGILKIHTSLEFLNWNSGAGTAAIVTSDTRGLRKMLASFRDGVVITFRKDRLYDYENLKFVKRVTQCNILMFN